MELDDLKYQLNRKLQAAWVSSPLRPGQLLQGQTRSVTGKIQRSLRIEGGLTGVLLLACMAMAFVTAGWPVKIYFGTLAAVLLGYIAWIGRLLFITSKVHRTLLPVKHHLRQVYCLVHLFARRYSQIGALLFPASLLFRYMLDYVALPGNPKELLPVPWRQWCWLILACIAGSLLAYALIRWYVHTLFGRYLEQLKACLLELEEEEAPVA